MAGPAAFFPALILATLFLAGCERSEPSSSQPAVETAAPQKGLDRSKAGQQAPDATLQDSEGEASTLADLDGQPVLVNLWATWCAPCVKELPTLQALSAQEGSLRVVAVSQDMAPRGSVDAFLEDRGLDGLEVWHDPAMAVSTALKADILPTTVLYDARGREVWRYVGDLDWTGAEAQQMLAEVSRAEAR